MLSHNKVPADIFDGKRILDIGCGRNKLQGAIGLDQNAYHGVDIVANLEDPLPLPDADFDLVFANQVLEHVRDLTPLLMEIHRILKPGGAAFGACALFQVILGTYRPNAREIVHSGCAGLLCPAFLAA